MSEYRYGAGDTEVTVRVQRQGERLHVEVNGRSYEVTLHRHAPGELHFSVDAQRCAAFVARTGGRQLIWLDGDMWTVQPHDVRQPRRSQVSTADDEHRLRATMPGQVIEVPVAPGDAVRCGDTLVLLEAMKMELRITAPHGGRVVAVHCAAGETVARDQTLVELTPDE